MLDRLNKLISLNWLQVALILVIAPAALSGAGLFLQTFPADKLLYGLAGLTAIVGAVIVIAKFWIQGYGKVSE